MKHRCRVPCRVTLAPTARYAQICLICSTPISGLSNWPIHANGSKHMPLGREQLRGSAAGAWLIQRSTPRVDPGSTATRDFELPRLRFSSGCWLLLSGNLVVWRNPLSIDGLSLMNMMIFSIRVSLPEGIHYHQTP